MILPSRAVTSYRKRISKEVSLDVCHWGLLWCIWTCVTVKAFAVLVYTIYSNVCVMD